MSCICSEALVRRPEEPGVLTATGADSAPDARRGSGRLAAARSATAAIAAKRTMASVTSGVIKFFITHFLKFGLRSPQSCLVIQTGRPAITTLWTATAGGVRPADELSPGPNSRGRRAVPRVRYSPKKPAVFAY
jgi:hypothetical protein